VRVLVVDDARVMRIACERILGTLGYADVASADRAANGLRAARELRPDAVVVDGRLVECDVPAYVAQLRAVLPQAAILVIAAIDEVALVRACVARGATGALKRPLLRSDVAARLQEAAAGTTAPGAS